uniref:Uncharacterized protein n=1 Tax=Setaria italica TaxID=4555 RepID=K4A3R2_SETIT
MHARTRARGSGFSHGFPRPARDKPSPKSPYRPPPRRGPTNVAASDRARNSQVAGDRAVKAACFRPRQSAPLRPVRLHVEET